MDVKASVCVQSVSARRWRAEQRDWREAPDKAGPPDGPSTSFPLLVTETRCPTQISSLGGRLGPQGGGVRARRGRVGQEG